MSDPQNHRGPHPEDRRLFSDARVHTLRLANEEAMYLLGRGYAPSTVIDVVAGRHQLESRQRMALQRCMCSEAQRAARRARQVQPADARGGVLYIDGLNLVIGLEVALSAGPLLRGTDGVLRDLAGLRGSYRLVAETEQALDCIGELLREIRPAQVVVYLDAPVPNSGRLKSRILQHAADWPCARDVELVPNPDRELVGRELVVSGDSVVIDASKSWINWLDHTVRTRLTRAWVIELSP